MKRLLGLIVAVLLVVVTVAGAGATDVSDRLLTDFDFSIVGLDLVSDPAYQAVPKGISSRVNTGFSAGEYDLEDIISQLPNDYTVRAELAGPAFLTPLQLVTLPGKPFDLPTLSVLGRYTLSNIRLCDASGAAIMGAVPQAVAVESIPDPLITQVTTRQLSVQELQERGVSFDKSNFTAYEFTAGIATSSGQVPIKLPVIIPTSQTVQQTPDIQGAVTISLPQQETYIIPPDVPETAVPQNLEVHPVIMEVQEKDKVGKLVLPPIPGVVVIPGNIGFLHQYFSALALVTNGAPLQSGLSIRDVRTTVNFPAGEDLIAGTDAVPGDDPLRMAKGTNGYFPRTMLALSAGVDGKVGSADDVDVMQPGESGQADFTIEGLKEGTHKVDFDITATLDGLPIGPVTLKGKASGAILVRNPDFSVTLGHPATVRTGEEYDLFITVTNTGKSIANLVSVGLDPRALSGAVFVSGEANSKEIDTILPGSAATVKFRLKSQRTGKVTATAFESTDVKGRFILRAGVGENGIPLSPDSLILPYTGTLPSDLVTSAVGLLGQAWSVATAPAGALPASVLLIGKSTITARAYDLSETGLRVLIGDNLVEAVADLTFDFFGSDVYNRGFDSLRRSSTMGLELNRAIANIFKTTIDADGALSFQEAMADKVSYRPGHLSVIASEAPLRMRLTDASGNGTGAVDSGTASRGIPYADSFPIGENGTSRTNLILATRLDSPAYTLELAADAAATFDLGILLPDANGVLTQYRFSGVNLPVGATAAMVIATGGASLQLAIDENNDGTVDRTIDPSSMAAINDHPPQIVAATQLTPDFGPGGDKHGRNVAVLFSERVTKESAQLVANYGVDENQVKQATIQPGGRMAFLLLREGIGPFFDRSLTAQGLVDQSGKTMVAAATLPIRITAKGPAAVVTGTVRTARGEPVPDATIRLYQLIRYYNPVTLELEDRYALFTEKQANSDGRYRLEYVLQNDPTGIDPSGPFQIEVMNPVTGEVGSLTTGVIYHGQRLQLDIFMKAKGSLSGVVINESGNPVSGATVQVITLSDNRGKSMSTDATGSFSFAGLMVGAYNIKAVSQATLSEGSIMGTLPEDGSSIAQDVTIRRVSDNIRGTVVGKVLGADGVTPRSGVIVILNGSNYQNWQRTGADGGFSFSGVYAGAVTVTARDDSTGEQSASSGSITASGQDITLNVIMKGTGSVVGTVSRDDKKSTEGLFVVARPPSPAQARVLQTDAAGAFRIDNLPTGNIGIEIIDPNDFNRTVASDSVTILSAGEVATIALFVPLKAMASGTIEGIVYHRNGTPWANAPIKRLASSYQYYSHKADSDGRFSIPALPLGSYSFSVVGGNEVINVTTDIWYDNQVRTLELRPVGIGTVTGTTWDDAAMTMPTGADVTFYSMKPNLVGWLTYGADPVVVKSDPQTGRFSFGNVLQGSFTVSSSNIFRPTPVTAGGKIETDGQVFNVNLPLKGSPPAPGQPPVNQPGSISGKVLKPDGTPVGKDVRVTVTFGGVDVTVTTDEQGLFHFAPIIPAGSQPIMAEDPVTTLRWRGSVYVPAGLDVPVTIKLLGRGSVTVKVLSASGEAVPDATITLKGTSYPNDSASGTSGSDGSVTFSNLSEGGYAISATGSGLLAGLGGRAQATIPADNAAATAEVRLDPSAIVTGRFLKADGVTPIPGGQITLKRGGQAIAYTSSSSDPSDIGSFRLEYVPLGDFSVEGYDPVTERLGSGGGRLVSNGETVRADVVVTPRGTVKGVVLNYGGSAPVGAAPIGISFNGGGFSSVTAPDGSFLFAGISSGRFTLEATDPANGLKGVTSGSLSYENETVTTQLRIAPTGSITGRVLIPDGQTPLTTATVYLNGGSPVQVNGETGIFRYDNLAAGRSYNLSSSQPGTRRSGSTIATINSDLEVANSDIILGGIGRVTGRVFEPGGATPLAGARVELRFGNELLTRSSGDDGSFGFEGIPTGSFTVAASHLLRSTAASKSGYLATEGQTVNADLVLGDVGSVRATVLMADGVTPSRGGGIRITTTRGQTTAVYTGITDSSGQYRFDNIPVPCSVALYVEDAAGVGIGRFYGVLETNGQILDTGNIVLDDKPIFVTGIDPENGAVNVLTNQTMRVTFSEPADPATLTSGTIYLAQGASRVAGSLQPDSDNRGVTFIPAVPLKGFTLYTLVVSGDVKDPVGRRLAQPQSVSFTTVDNVPPELTGISPANGSLQIAGDAVIRISFSEPLDASTLGGITLTSGGTAVPVRTDLIQGGTVVALTPLEPLSLNRTYSVTVSGAKDSAGNILSVSTQSGFTTIDTVVPTITALTVPPSTDLVKGNPIPVTAAVADTDVALVDFYREDQLVGTVTKAPFTIAVVPDREGLMRLKAIAQDRVGNRGIPATLDLVIAADQPPTVGITVSAEGASVNTGATFSVFVQGTDDLSLKEISVTLSGAMTASQTKTVSGKSVQAIFSFTAPAGIAGNGVITISATTRDSANNTAPPVLRNIVMHDSIAPSAISLASPGQTVKYRPGETAAALFMASDNVAVTSITCTATGAAGDSRTYTIDPALATVSRGYEFQVPADAAPYAAITVTCSAADAAGNSSSKSLSLTVADTVPPSVTGASIVDNAVNVPTTGSFVVIFNEALDVDTVTAASVFMTGSGQPVSGSVALSGDGTRVTFMPTLPLVRGTAYTLFLSATISDEVGNPLPHPYSLTFTTDSTVPAMTAITPANGSVNVPVGSGISVSFDEMIDPASVTSDKVSLTSISGEVPGAVTVAADGLSLTFKPYNQLGYARVYTFTLAAGIMDISGNATASALTSTFTTQNPDSNLIGYWPMDGDWTDYSGNGNHGTANGGATFSSDRVVGTQVGSFDGVNDYVAIADNDGLSPQIQGQMTISAWVKLRAYPSGGQNRAPIIAKGTPNNYEYALYVNSDGSTGLDTWQASGCCGFTSFMGGKLLLNQWYNVTAVFDLTNSKKVTVYVDGAEIGRSTTTSGSISNGTSPVYIGSRPDNAANQYINALIDDIYLYKSAFKTEDVLEHYNAGLTTDRTPPVAPTVEPVPATTYYNQIVLRGTKEAGSSIRVNGKQIVAHDDNATWQVLYTLSLGQNLLEVTSRDPAGNASPAVNMVVDLLPAEVGGATYTDCADIKEKNPFALSGSYQIDPDGAGGNAPFTAYCSVTSNGSAWTFSLADGGITTRYQTDNDSCKTKGLSIFAPRSKADYESARQYLVSIGRSSGFGPLGVYYPQNGPGCCQSWTTYTPMNSDWAGKNKGWKSTAGDTWWVSDLTTVSEPNGDYSANGWLSFAFDVSGNVNWYNDQGSYGYSTYLCSRYPRNNSANSEITITSPGQSVRYKPGDAGTATVTATTPNGIAKLYCNVSGAVSQGSLVETFDPPQTSVARDVSFTVSADAAVHEAYRVSCIVETAAGALGSANLDLQATDPIPPVVISTSIANNSTTVPITSTITSTFSKPMTAATISSTTVTLSKDDGSAMAVSGTVTLSADGKSVTFTPLTSLAGLTSYKMVVSNTVRDQDGNLLGSDYILCFTTLPATAVIISGQGTSSAPYPLNSGLYSYIQIVNSYVVVTGPVTADTITLGNSTLTHKQTGTSGSERLEMNVTNMIIDSTSKIDVSGKGYPGGYGNSTPGRTVGNTTTGGSLDRNGGSYGGLGGNVSGNTVNVTYGDYADPNDVGSGGGGYCYMGYSACNNYYGGNGGGLTRLVVGTLNLDGSILADGMVSNGNVGGGSGGGVRIDVGTLSGTGNISARGGSSQSGGSGGGGRIAIYYDSMTLPTSNVKANGGASGTYGGAGTLYLKQQFSSAKGELIIDNNGVTSIPTPLAGGSFGNVTVKNSQVSLGGNLNAENINVINGTLQLANGMALSADTLTLSNNGVLTHKQTGPSGAERLELSVTTLTIDSTSKVDASGKGFAGGYGNSTPARTVGNTTSGGSSTSNGGSYGGLGGNKSGGTVNVTYGNYADPNDVGSSGGGAYYSNAAGYPVSGYGGNGGGLVRITAGTINLSGSILADGRVDNSEGGGGSGGGIRIDVGTLSGNGTISARGGSTNNGSGGGGRIAIYYDALNLPMANIVANGGSSGKAGGAGTLYLRSRTAATGTIYIDNKSIVTSSLSTPFPAVGIGNVGALTANTLTRASGSWQASALKGLKIRPDISKEKYFTIVDNSATVITVDAADGDLIQATAVDASYSGITVVNDALVVTGKAWATATDPLVQNNTAIVSGSALFSADSLQMPVGKELIIEGGSLYGGSNGLIADSISVRNGGVITHWDTTASTGNSLVMDVATLTIDATSKIDVSGKGYAGGYGNTTPGRTVGNTTTGGSGTSNGGSYGGLGGNRSGGTVNVTYGNYADPNDVGSGGGGAYYFNYGGSLVTAYGGNGGGLMRITAGTINLSGSILADGGVGNSEGGGGSGGAIRIDVGTLSGSGTISARGGASYNGSGGGGRIAVYYGVMSFPSNKITAAGGSSGVYGMPGTVHLVQQ